MIHISNNLNIIVFNKSSMYMFGVGLGFFSFLFFIIYKIVKEKDFNAKYGNYILLISLISIFVFPQIISYYVHKHIEKINYIECTEESTFKAKYTEYIFAKDKKACKTYKK